MIRVAADLDTCLEWVRTRSSLEHIPVSNAKVVQYNRVAAQVHFDWDLEIDNNGPATNSELLEAISLLENQEG